MTETGIAERAAPGGGSAVHRFHRTMDVTGLLSLAWAAALAFLAGGLRAGSAGNDAPPIMLWRAEHVPGDVFAGFTQRGLLVACAVLLAVPLVLVVVFTFGRAGAAFRTRRLAGAPLMAGLAVLLLLRTMTSFSLSDALAGVSYESSTAQFWDPAIVTVAACGITVLVLREPKLPSSVRGIAASSVVLTVISFLLYAGLTLHSMVVTSWASSEMSRAWWAPLVVWAPILSAAVMTVLGVVLVRGVVAGKRWAVNGIVVWGAAVWGQAVLSQYLLSLTFHLPVVGVGLTWGLLPPGGIDWLGCAVAVGAATLVPALYRSYRLGDAHRRSEHLARASGFTGLLLLTLLFLQSVGGYWLWVILPGSYLVFDLVVALVAAAGAVILLTVAWRPGGTAMSTRLMAAAALIAVPQFVYVLVRVLAGGSLYAGGGNDGARITPVLNVWDGYRVMLMVILPVALAVVAYRSKAAVQESG